MSKSGSVEKSEFEKRTKQIDDSIQEIRLALLVHGICPDCGRDIEGKDQQLDSFGDFKIWKCPCGLEQMQNVKFLKKQSIKSESASESDFELAKRLHDAIFKNAQKWPSDVVGMAYELKSGLEKR